MFKVYTLTDGQVSNLIATPYEDAAHIFANVMIADLEAGDHAVEQAVIVVDDPNEGDDISDDATTVREHTVEQH